jgi:tetratricopeptide (TPR) repeat protein
LSQPVVRVVLVASTALVLLCACATVQATSAAAPAAAQTSPSTPEQASAYGSYLAGRLAASEHDMPEAARLFRQSLIDDPNNPDLLGRALLYTAGAGNVDEASRLAERVIATTPDDRIARLTLAVDALKRQDYAAAREQIAKSAKGPFTALTLSLLDAWAAQGQGKTDAALASLKDVTTEGGTAALQTFHSALILDLAGRNGDAEAAYRQALTQAPDSPRMVEGYGRFLERSGRAADVRAFYTGHANDIALAPVIAVAQARVAAGKMPERLVPSAEAGAAESLFGIAASLSDEASADVAILYLRFALCLQPDFDLAKIVLADRFEALRKFDDAIQVYRSIAADSPFRFSAAVQIAADETRLNQNDKAVADLVALTQQKPADITGWTALGDAYRSTEKYAQAGEAYDHAVKLLNPITKKDWPLFYARGVAEERSHNWAAAEQDLQQALKLSPDQPQVLNYLGYSWVDQGRNLPQAVAMLERARALSPTDGYIVDSVGWAYYRLGRYQDAAKTLEEAVLLVPGDPTINEHLGDAYWKVGRKLDAHFQWSHALAFGPDEKQKAQLEKKLQSGLAATARNG